jgi:hypothetical protein
MKTLRQLREKAPIVRKFKGFIVLAQSELDYESKCKKISRGDTFGFYTTDDLLKEER